MDVANQNIEDLAGKLASLHEAEFGGKPRGRYRISQKFLRRLAGRKRLYPDMIEALRRAMYERGLALIDLDTFYVVLSIRTFSTYRRVGPTIAGGDDPTPDDDGQADDDTSDE